MKNLLLLSLIFLFSCKPSFEKDGGVRIVVEASNADKTQLESIKLILLKRLDLFGIANPIVRSGDKPELLIVEIPGKVEDLQRLRAMLQSSSKLEFWETYDNKEIYEKLGKLNIALSEELYPELKDTVKEKEVEIKEGASLDEQFAAQKSEKEIEEEKMNLVKKQHPVFSLLSPSYVYDASQQVQGLSAGPIVGFALAKDTSKINSYLNSPTAKSIFGSKVKFLWTLKPIDESQKVYQLIAIRIGRSGKAPLSGDIVKNARVIFNDNGGAPQIALTMNQVAGFDFAKMTRINIGNAIAIVVDDMVYSYPVVNGEIPGGNVSIEGNFTTEEAQDFASILNAGYLPVPIRIVSEQTVAPKK
jgi:SecD/SecF fusion protein